MNNNSRLLWELADSFVKKQSKNVDYMRIHISNGNYGNARGIIHDLKGMTGNLCMTLMYEELVDIEQKLKTGKQVDFEKFDALWKKTRFELEQYIKEYKQPDEENDEKIVIKNKEKLTIKEKVKSTTMLMLAVTLHNIPEGMAVGVAFAGLFSQNTGITLAEAFALAIGIAIQNIPEGAIISMPLHSSGKSKFKSFLGGTLSGIVEPIGAIITIALTRIVVPILPYFLSFAAGAMIYVVSSELIPEAQAEKKSNLVTISVGIGFVIMMLLDVALG